MLIANNLKIHPDRLNNFYRYIRNRIKFETYKFGKVELRRTKYNRKQLSLIKSHISGTSYLFETVCNKLIPLSQFKKTKDFGGNSNKLANQMGRKLIDASEKTIILSLYKDISTKEDTNEPLFINNINLFNQWRNTFIHIKKPILSLIDGDIDNYFVLHDSSSRSHLLKLLNNFCKLHKIKKDLWSPSDIWLIRKNKYRYINKILNENINEISSFNKELYLFAMTKDIIPISLKQLYNTKFKIEPSNIPPHIKPSFRDITLDKIHNYMGLDVNTIGGFTFLDKDKNKISFQTRGFTTSTSATQTEIITDGNKSGGRVGKVPSDIIKKLYLDYGNYNKIIPQQYFGLVFENVTQDTINDWIKWYNVIKEHPNVVLHHNIDNIEKHFISWTTLSDSNQIRIAKYKIQGLMMQYWILKLEPAQLSDLINEMILGAKKISNIGGFFYKIY